MINYLKSAKANFKRLILLVVGISVLRNTKPFFRQGKIDKKGKDH